jgi:hypothetical protein
MSFDPSVDWHGALGYLASALLVWAIVTGAVVLFANARQNRPLPRLRTPMFGSRAEPRASSSRRKTC